MVAAQTKLQFAETIGSSVQCTMLLPAIGLTVLPMR